MKLIIASICLYIIGLIFIVGDILDFLSPSLLGISLFYLGIIFIITSLILFFFHKNILKNINGILVSSRLTLIHKFFSSFIVIILILFVTFGLVDTLIKKGFEITLLLAIILFIISAFIPFRMITLKQVMFDREFLYISNYKKLKKVSLSDIESVKANILFYIYRIKYQNQGKTETCYFMVKTKFLSYGVDDSFKDFKSAIDNAKQ